MRRWRLHAAAMVIGAASVCGAPDASAQTTVLPSPADTSELRELQVAYSVGPDRSTLWFGARVYGASDQLFVLVPAAPGAMVDTSSDAWFEALRLATSPRVLPPGNTPPACDKGNPPAAGSYELIGDANHTPSLAPAAGGVVRTFSEVVLWAQGAGLNLTFDQLSTLADLDVAGFRFVTIPFDPAPGETVLRTIRVASPGTTARVPLLLSRTGATSARAFVWVMSEGKATPTGWPWTTVDTQKLAWKLDGTSPRSNYDELWSSALDQRGNQAWMLEAASLSSLLSTTSFASGKASVPSVASTFFSRASGYGDADTDFQSCVMRVEAMVSSASRVGGACAPGAVASIAAGDAGACSEEPSAGEIDPAELRCGAGADDFALAFAGMTPSKIWLTRWSGRIGAWQSRPEEPFKVEPGSPLLPVLVCPNWDSSGCGTDAGAPGAGGSSGGSDAGALPPGQSGGTVPGGSTPYDPTQDQPPADDTSGASGSVYVETSCWGDSTSSTSQDSSSDSCGGDSSSSSSSDGASACGGDSSSSSSDGNSACSGDSSSSDGNSACGGDSSSSSSSGDSCSGSSSSGEDSACSGSSSSSSSGSSGCSGGGSSSGSSNCSISSQGRRGGRLPMSALTLLIVTLVWPLRRWRRAAERRVD